MRNLFKRFNQFCLASTKQYITPDNHSKNIKSKSNNSHHSHTQKQNQNQSRNRNPHHLTLKQCKQFINRYQTVGNDIPKQQLITHLKSLSANHLRQQSLSRDFNHIFKNIPPLLQKNIHFLASQRTISNVCLSYLSLNLHRKQVFNILQESWDQIHSFLKNDLHSSMSIYRMFVEFNHKGNSGLKSKIKVTVKSTLQRKSANMIKGKQRWKSEQMLKKALQYLKYLLMDKEFDQQQALTVLELIEEQMIPIFETFFIEEKWPLFKLFQSVHQLLQYREIKPQTHKFQLICQCAMSVKTYSKLVSKNQTYQSEDHQKIKSIEIDLRSQPPKIQKETMVVKDYYKVLGAGSVFERIFEENLRKNGYIYEKNPTIGCSQYDFKIIGKKFKEIYPFAQNKNETNGSDSNRISISQWFQLQCLNDQYSIAVNKKFDDSIILNLNGPSHYIDSDQNEENDNRDSDKLNSSSQQTSPKTSEQSQSRSLINKKITRTDEFKGLLLKNYGYRKYNIVNYQQWQYTNERSVLSARFIEKLLSENILDEAE